MARLVTIVIAYMAMAVYGQQGSGQQESSQQEAAQMTAEYYEALQTDYAHYMLIAMASTVILFFIFKTSLRFTSHLRHLYAQANENQRYFARSDYRMALLKKHLVDAPLLRTRHNREFQLSRAVHMGTLPNRFQAICLAGIIAMNVSLCVLNIPFSEAQSYPELLRNRTGTLAVTNLIPLVILVGRNNPLIPLLGLSFDTWNFFHRWIARIVALEGIAHMLTFVVAEVKQSGWAGLAKEIRGEEQITTGLIVCKTSEFQF
jgi:Ferric reductase like transmembrane component